MKETWKPIIEKYEVSNMGRVRNGITKHVLRPSLGGAGYPCVCLSINGKVINRWVHCLVAAAFLGPKSNFVILNGDEIEDEGIEVNHKNGVKTDNRAVNLEYLTHADNLLYAIRSGVIMYGSSGTKHPYAEYRLRYEETTVEAVNASKK